jgi:hypothetical protein
MLHKVTIVRKGERAEVIWLSKEPFPAKNLQIMLQKEQEKPK